MEFGIPRPHRVPDELIRLDCQFPSILPPGISNVPDAVPHLFVVTVVDATVSLLVSFSSTVIVRVCPERMAVSLRRVAIGHQLE